MNLKHLLLAFALLTLGTSAIAQTSDNEIADIQQRVTELEKKSSFATFADKHLKLSGYLQGAVQWDESSSNQTTFLLRRARVSLSGAFLKNTFDYRLQVDMAGSPKICDLYMRYIPLKEIGMQLGQFKVPFSLENETYGPTKLEFIEYSYLTTYLARNNGAYDGISATGRDMGFQLFGGFIKRDGFSIINYNLALLNGSGINNKDNNSSKDVVARLIVKPIKGLSISGSFMYAETKHNDYTYMKSPRWSAGVSYDYGNWVARSEYTTAKFDQQQVDAFYILAGYHFDKPWTVAARYEFINDNMELLDKERITVGAAYKPIKYLRLQLNYSYTIDKDLPFNSNGVAFMATAIF